MSPKQHSILHFEPDCVCSCVSGPFGISLCVRLIVRKVVFASAHRGLVMYLIPIGPSVVQSERLSGRGPTEASVLVSLSGNSQPAANNSVEPVLLLNQHPFKHSQSVLQVDGRSRKQQLAVQDVSSSHYRPNLSSRQLTNARTAADLVDRGNLI